MMKTKMSVPVNKLVIYPYLPIEGQIDYVSADDPFMRRAEAVCQVESTDRYHPTGAVVVLEGEIVGRGANQARLRQPRLAEWHRRGFCLRRFLKIPSGRHYWLCPGCSPFSAHAEARAVKDALRREKDLRGAVLYLWGHWWCCQACWRVMLAVGIKQVYLLEGSEKLWK